MRDKTPIREQVAARKTASPQRVKPLALGDLAKNGTSQIEAECEWCRHAARLDVAALIERAGAAALYRDIVKKLRCSVCGWNRVEAWPVRDGGEMARRRAGALPPLDECRALLASVPVDPHRPLIERRSALIHALRERWPDLTATAALFVVQTLWSDPSNARGPAGA